MIKKATRDKEAEYEQKFKELEAREMRLKTLEALNAREMPKELADVIVCKDDNDLKAKLDALQKIYGNKEEKEAGVDPTRVGGYSPAGGGVYVPDPIRKAMGLKR